MYVRPCLTGHDSKTWPIVLHPRHVKRSSRVSVGCTSLSILTVLLSTISSEFESCSMDVSTVTSVPPGPSSGKVGLDAGGCNPSLGLFSVLSVSGGSSMASWYNCAISSSPMVISKYGTSLVIGLVGYSIGLDGVGIRVLRRFYLHGCVVDGSNLKRYSFTCVCCQRYVTSCVGKS